MNQLIYLVALAIGGLALQPVARAHDPGLSALTVQHTEARISYQLLVNDAVLPLARRGATCDPEGIITASLDGQVLSSVARCHAAEAGHTSFEGEIALPRAGALTLSLALLGALPRGHQSYLRVLDEAGKVVSDRMLALGNADAQLTVQAAPQTAFFALGLTHILTGFDHLLFLGVLLLGVSGMRRMAAVVSCFTLAHSLTLALATLQLVRLPSAWVEATIAASVVYVAVRGCFATQPDTERLLVTFGFGLVHGLGFASALDILRGADSTFDVIGPLLRFNLGVEVGQLLVGVPLLPILSWVRTHASPRFEARRLLSGAAAMIGLFWLLERSL